MCKIRMVLLSLCSCFFSQNLQAEKVIQPLRGAAGGFLVEGVDGDFYVTDPSSSNLFKFRPDGTFQMPAHPACFNDRLTLADDVDHSRTPTACARRSRHV